MRRFSVIALLLFCLQGFAQTISYFNQGFLRQPSAAADRIYLGVTTNAGPQGPAGPVGPIGPQGPPGTNAVASTNYVLKSGDTMTGPLKTEGTITNELDNITSTNISIQSLTTPNITFNQIGAGAYPALGPASLIYSQLADYPGGSQDPGLHFTDTAIFHSYTPSGIGFISYGQANFWGGVVALNGFYYGNGLYLSNVVAASGWPTTWPGSAITSAVSQATHATNADNAATATTASGGWVLSITGTTAGSPSYPRYWQFGVTGGSASFSDSEYYIENGTYDILTVASSALGIGTNIIARCMINGVLTGPSVTNVGIASGWSTTRGTNSFTLTGGTNLASVKVSFSAAPSSTFSFYISLRRQQ